MNRSLHKAGLIVAASIPIFVLPARISEGQLNDPVNLVGSEIVIFLMCLACWYCIHYLQSKFRGFAGLLLSVLCCCLLSNLFYFTFNPFFKDFPFRTPEKFLLVKIAMLSSRGILMSVILVPAAYYIKRDQEARRQREENQRLVMEKFEIENRMLEEAVLERTGALHDALNSLEESQRELEHQVFVQSRLVASITHDVRGPFKFLLIVSDSINRLIQNGEYETVAERSKQLHTQLESMHGFINNLLDFAKLPVQQKISRREQVNISEVIIHKQTLFAGMIKSRANKLIVNTDPNVLVATNLNLFSIVLHNLIDNANKHSSEGEIKIRSLKEESGARIIIENTGNAVSGKIIEWMNSETGDSGMSIMADPDITPGIGLILVKEIASLLNISIRMKHDSGVTTVSLRFADLAVHDVVHSA